jgi:hypothetical protein
MISFLVEIGIIKMYKNVLKNRKMFMFFIEKKYIIIIKDFDYF